MGWVAFMVLAVIFAGTLYWVRQRMAARLAELEGAHTRRVAALTSEADARTARVEKASLAEAERRGVALAEDLLPVADALKLAVEVEEGASTQEVRDGVELARRELERAFRAHQIEPIEPEIGDAFDPALHEAVERRGEGGDVVAVHRAGYVHGDRVLRSAMVAVGEVDSTGAQDELGEPAVATASVGDAKENASKSDDFEAS